MSMSVFVSGSARFRVGRHQGDPDTAQLVVLSEAHTLTDGTLASVREQLRYEGCSQVFTSAVSPSVRDVLRADGFDDHECLDLLSHDLADLPSLPPRSAGVRKGRRSDRSDVLAVDRQAFEPFWQIDPAGLRESILATPVSRHRVVRRNGAVVGYSIAGMGGRTGFLQRLAVAPLHQGSRHGTALVADCLHWASRSQAMSMWVNTQESNSSARRFYLRLGFVQADHHLTVLHRRL